MALGEDVCPVDETKDKCNFTEAKQELINNKEVQKVLTGEWWLVDYYSSWHARYDYDETKLEVLKNIVSTDLDKCNRCAVEILSEKTNWK